MYTRVKTASEINNIRESGKLLAHVLNVLCKDVVEGVSTKELADIAAKELKLIGGKPAFLGYQGFPDVICISVNEEVVHGIPKTDKIIKNGDIVSLDFGVNYRGMITDAATTYIVGKAAPKDKALVDTTSKSLDQGINVIHDRIRTGDIGFVIGQELAKHNYGIIRDLVGHGVGHYLHEEPNIPNYGRRNTGPELLKGMTVAIEPMATLGGYEIYVADDNWTIITADHSRSAHFEKTVLITEEGAEILTNI